MRFLNHLPYFLFGGLLILHGLAHMPGVLGTLGLATFEDVSRQPNVLLSDSGEGVVIALGIVWLMATIAFLVAGVGVLREAAWWPMAAAVAIVVSLPTTMLWRHDAVIGLVINAVMLAGLVVWFGFSSVSRHRETA